MKKLKIPTRVPILLAVIISVVGLAFATARLRWPHLSIDEITIGFLVLAVLPWLPMILESAEVPGVKVKFRDQEPALRMVMELLPSIAPDEELPDDYLFLNHTSFYLDGTERHKAEQAAIRKKTEFDQKHYHIQVIVDSYYDGAIDRVDHVEYTLHEAFPKPVRRVSNRHERFLLKEMANGEFVLLAKAYLKGQSEPILLKRYITLWDTGPRILHGLEDS